jgi:hypothetical protein
MIFGLSRRLVEMALIVIIAAAVLAFGALAVKRSVDKSWRLKIANDNANAQKVVERLGIESAEIDERLLGELADDYASLRKAERLLKEKPAHIPISIGNPCPAVSSQCLRP